MSPRRRPEGSGARDRRITVQTLTESVGTSHRPVETWEDLYSPWAYREDMGGRERFVADQTSAPYDTRWEIDFIASMDPENPENEITKKRRITHNGRVYDIVAANQLGRKDGIELFTLSGGVVE